eukprot:CAMPEP_0172538224 /NCGR_PEP_ID=MMETSP1067-20121228/9657_1 /TAXON_ID=265564 ORGANISM="Thalassiosira punctigera, Strain Tpunct2005C2" /NCGR_SAMPLE_ID=MMETSP1067 /ASSEMBLY_ACC=CAM_ASM_000444 /LENGTH=625 /DNA_ID=CAMNT_0013323679 /DNA_START=60 /DNA_END=1938 /DNA_ORIENTATION=-
MPQRQTSGAYPQMALFADSRRRPSSSSAASSVARPRRWLAAATSELRAEMLSASSALSSSPDSFHGLSLPEDEEKAKAKPRIEEAEVVKSEEDKFATREMIKEMTRAEISAHSFVSSGKKNDAGGASSEKKPMALGPYERLSQQLNEAQHRHQSIDPHQTSAYAQSCMDMGDLHYRLGHMDQSQEFYMDALKDLLSIGDGGDPGSRRMQMMTAQSMHALGTIHARCGDYAEASHWYEESLKRKHELSDDIEGDGSTAPISHRYELGKTYNGLAALEVMRGGDVQWEKAMSLFQEAERNFLYYYEREKMSQQEKPDRSESDVLETVDVSATIIISKALRKMTPSQVESLVNVRSNMGELLRQRGKFEDAEEMLRLALDTARMALENDNEIDGTRSEIKTSAAPIDGPTRDEQASAIVDLLVKIADNLTSAEKFDEAAEAYEHALSSHVFYRRPSEEDDAKPQSSNALPATVHASTKIKFDLDAATTIEAAIRNNLAHALAQIGQDKLSMEHYEASLAIKRRIGGDFHMEVAHTLAGMGALLGGPLRDFTKGLNCFKEALFIYRANLEELSGGYQGDDGCSDNQRSFFGDEDAEEIDRHIQNTLKNISLIEAALLKDRDGLSKKRRH